MIKLGIIDLGYRNTDALTATHQVVEYAVEADALGYSKFWLAEHHYNHFKNHSFTSPDILVTLIAGMTENLKIGSAGTSISSYSPYSIVTNYKLLNNLFYGRISLGISKGIPDSEYVCGLLNKELTVETSGEMFNHNLKKIVDLLENEEQNLRDKGILIPPYAGLKPELWYLSTSFKNQNVAIEYGLNYCVSIFHNFGQDIDNLPYTRAEIDYFKETFFKNHHRFPELAMSLAIVIRERLEDAIEEVGAIKEKLKNQGMNEAFKIIPTTVELLYQRLHTYREIFGIEEFILYDVEHDNKVKIEHIRCISQRFNF